MTQMSKYGIARQEGTFQVLWATLGVSTQSRLQVMDPMQ